MNNEIEIIRGDGFNHFHIKVEFLKMENDKVITNCELKIGDIIYKDGEHLEIKRVVKVNEDTYESILVNIR